MTKKYEYLIQAIDERTCLEFLARMVRYKSYSNTPGETDLSRFMVDRMNAIGLNAQLQQVDAARYNAIGRLNGTGGGKSLLFNGHLDTNPTTEGWTVDPWGGVMDDNFIYGIGVSNMKAGDAAYRTVRGQSQPTGAIRPPCFFGTDAAHFLHKAGMPGIVCGPGGRYNTMPDERVEIADYLDMIRIYILAILNICEPADSQ